VPLTSFPLGTSLLKEGNAPLWSGCPRTPRHFAALSSVPATDHNLISIPKPVRTAKHKVIVLRPRSVVSYPQSPQSPQPVARGPLSVARSSSILAGRETAEMARTNFEKLEVYKLSERLADEIWVAVISWDRFARDTVGKQVVRAADSIGANFAAGAGRGS